MSGHTFLRNIFFHHVYSSTSVKKNHEDLENVILKNLIFTNCQKNYISSKFEDTFQISSKLAHICVLHRKSVKTKKQK